MQVGYTKISATRTKYFFEKEGRTVELVIDHMVDTQMADVWFKAGEVSGIMPFIEALAHEADKAQYIPAAHTAAKMAVEQQQLDHDSEMGVEGV